MLVADVLMQNNPIIRFRVRDRVKGRARTRVRVRDRVMDRARVEPSD